MAQWSSGPHTRHRNTALLGSALLAVLTMCAGVDGGIGSSTVARDAGDGTELMSMRADHPPSPRRVVGALGSPVLSRVVLQRHATRFPKMNKLEKHFKTVYDLLMAEAADFESAKGDDKLKKCVQESPLRDHLLTLEEGRKDHLGKCLKKMGGTLLASALDQELRVGKQFGDEFPATDIVSVQSSCTTRTVPTARLFVEGVLAGGKGQNILSAQHIQSIEENRDLFLGDPEQDNERNRELEAVKKRNLDLENIRRDVFGDLPPEFINAISHVLDVVKHVEETGEELPAEVSMDTCLGVIEAVVRVVSCRVPPAVRAALREADDKKYLGKYRGFDVGRTEQGSNFKCNVMPFLVSEAWQAIAKPLEALSEDLDDSSTPLEGPGSPISPSMRSADQLDQRRSARRPRLSGTPHTSPPSVGEGVPTSVMIGHESTILGMLSLLLRHEDTPEGHREEKGGVRLKSGIPSYEQVTIPEYGAYFIFEVLEAEPSKVDDASDRFKFPWRLCSLVVQARYNPAPFSDKRVLKDVMDPIGVCSPRMATLLGLVATSHLDRLPLYPRTRSLSPALVQSRGDGPSIEDGPHTAHGDNDDATDSVKSSPIRVVGYSSFGDANFCKEIETERRLHPCDDKDVVPQLDLMDGQGG